MSLFNPICSIRKSQFGAFEEAGNTKPLADWTTRLKSGEHGGKFRERGKRA